MLRRRRPQQRRPDHSVRWIIPDEERPPPAAVEQPPAPEPEAGAPGPEAGAPGTEPAIPGPAEPEAVQPQAPAAPEPEAEPEDMSIEALRARLAARGLVRTQPSVRIREVTPDQPRPAPAAPVEWAAPAPPSEDDDRAEAKALEPEDDGPRTPVRCPTCRSTTQVAVSATGFQCSNCDRVWRWAICGACNELTLTVARQESWRCGACGNHTRSWWRTGTAARERGLVQDRRRDEAARRERERVLAAARRRRWKLIVAGIVVVLMAAAVAGVVTLGGATAPGDHSRAACNRYERFRTQVANGTLSGPAAAAEVGEIRQLANEADAEVAAAAAELAAAGPPGTAKFLIASTEMADACAAAGA